jgi:hypothetical protein
VQQPPFAFLLFVADGHAGGILGTEAGYRIPFGANTGFKAPCKPFR